jgi:hypothetical protein
MTKTYTLTFDEIQLNNVALGISELPFKIAQPLIALIQQQVQDQQVLPIPKEEETTN